MGYSETLIKLQGLMIKFTLFKIMKSNVWGKYFKCTIKATSFSHKKIKTVFGSGKKNRNDKIKKVGLILGPPITYAKEGPII